MFVIMVVTGVVFDIKKYAIHDGPGIRTTVFLKGCPMDCWWCHNPEGKKQVKTMGNLKGDRRYSVQELMDEIEKDRVFYEESHGGVTFSGGEPLEQVLFLRAMLQACRSKQIHTIVDTCGYGPYLSFEKINGLVDKYFFDVKLVDDVLHKKYTGRSNKGIFGNLQRLVDDKQSICVRVPLIPGITDTVENLEAIAMLLQQFKSIHEVSLLPYNYLVSDKLKRYSIPNRLGWLETQSPQELIEKKKVFSQYGFNVKIGG